MYSQMICYLWKLIVAGYELFIVILWCLFASNVGIMWDNYRKEKEYETKKAESSEIHI